MRNFLTTALTIVLLAACTTPEPDAPAREIKFHVAGMYCDGCVSAITDHMGKLDGAMEIHVSLDDSLVTARFPGNKIPSSEELSELMELLGYTYIPIEEANVDTDQ